MTHEVQGWEDLMRLVELGKAKDVGSPLAGLADDVERNAAPWKAWTSLEDPEASTMPSDLTAKLSLFEQLLVGGLAWQHVCSMHCTCDPYCPALQSSLNWSSLPRHICTDSCAHDHARLC